MAREGMNQHVLPCVVRGVAEALTELDDLLDRLPEGLVHRGAVLRELSRQKRNHFYQNYIGTTRPVLFETANEAKLDLIKDNLIDIKNDGSLILDKDDKLILSSHNALARSEILS